MSLTVETLVREPELQLSEVTEKSEGLDICDDTVEAVEGDIDAVEGVGKGIGPAKPEALLNESAPFGSKRTESSSVSGELLEHWVVTLEKVREREREREQFCDWVALEANICSISWGVGMSARRMVRPR